MEPSYNKRALNNHCKTIPVKKCPCKLSWLCEGIFHSGAMNPYDVEQAALKELYFPSCPASVEGVE
jgi:hypothetical protein